MPYENLFTTDQDKAACFDELCKHFYEHNFGQMSKADIELLMFHFYITKLNEMAKNGDAKNTDYAVSKELGISQQRVRNLKTKEFLVYPQESGWDWKKEFSKLIFRAKLDEERKKIRLNIEDPNLFNELKNYIEEQGSYVDIQLNSKIFEVRVDQFLDLALSVEDDAKKKEIRKELKKKFDNDRKENGVFDEKHPFKAFINDVESVKSMLELLKKTFSPGNVLFQPLINLVKGVKEAV